MTPNLSGDFDADGDVDGADFLVWQRGNSPDPLSAGDLADWQTGYGSPLSAAAAVPEPGSAALLMMMVGMLLRIRWGADCAGSYR